ncbi:hypothetical protein C8R43DRAFT_946408 [Mycena crocata]|nr:hypothetical protein C8R43DRAFT_946408 [Mycena crocata]
MSPADPHPEALFLPIHMYRDQKMPFKMEVQDHLIPPSPDIMAIQAVPSSNVFKFELDPLSPGSSAQAEAQGRYRAHYLQVEHDESINRKPPTSRHQGKVAIRVPGHRDPEVDLRKKKSSERLRASKTFAAFREYIEEYMIWITVDDTDPEDVAAYDKFLGDRSPTHTDTLSDDSMEFLFRHVNPKPENIDDDRWLLPTVNDSSRSALPLPYTPRLFHFYFADLPALPLLYCDMRATPTRRGQEDEQKREERRRQARERMAQRCAAVKTLPPAIQSEILERARASRAKYRAQHRLQLLIKERCRREDKSRANHTLDEFIRRRRRRESKAAAQAKTKSAEEPEVDELME